MNELYIADVLGVHSIQQNIKDCSLKCREYRHDLFNNPKGTMQ